MQLFRIYMKKIWHSRKMLIALVIMFGLILVNYTINIIDAYEAHYVEEIYGFLNVSLLSSNSTVGAFFIIIFPILVVFPTSTLFLIDRETQAGISYRVRTSRLNYYASMFAAVFVSTFLLFSIPFLIEMIMEMLAFGTTANGMPVYSSYVDFLDAELKFWNYGLFIQSRLLYGLIYYMMFGFLSAVLATFNFSLTMLPIFKYKIFTYFPIFLMLYGLQHVIIEIDGELFKVLDYVTTLRMYDMMTIYLVCWALVSIALIMISAGMLVFRVKSEER